MEAVYTSLDTRRDGTVSSLVVQLRPLTWLCERGSGWAGGEAEGGDRGWGRGCSRGWGRSSDPEGHRTVADKRRYVLLKGEGR